MASDDQRVRPNEEHVAAKVMDGEAILINLSNGMYYSMGEIGGLVWALVEQGASVREMADLISDRLGVAAEGVVTDVDALVAELLQEELVLANSDGLTFSGELPPGTGVPSSYSPPKLEKFSDMAEMFALDPPLPGLAEAPHSDEKKETSFSSES